MRILNPLQPQDISEIGLDNSRSSMQVNVAEMITDEEWNVLINDCLNAYYVKLADPLNKRLNQQYLLRDGADLAFFCREALPSYLMNDEMRKQLLVFVHEEPEIFKSLDFATKFQRIYQCTLAEMGFRNMGSLTSSLASQIEIQLRSNSYLARTINIAELITEMANLRLLTINAEPVSMFTDSQWEVIAKRMQESRFKPGNLIIFMREIAALKVADPIRFATLDLDELNIMSAEQLLTEFRDLYQNLNGYMFDIAHALMVLFNDIEFTDRGLQIAASPVSELVTGLPNTLAY